MKVCYTGGAVTDHGSYYAVATNAVELRIWFLTDDILRIRAGFDGDWDEASYSLTMTAWDSRTDELMKDCRKRVQPAEAALTDGGKQAVIQGKRLKVVIEKAPFRIMVYDKDGSLLHADIPDLAYREDSNHRRIHASQIEADDCFYGFGEKSGEINKAEKYMNMAPGDAMGYNAKETDSLYKHIPFYIRLNRGTRQAVGYFYHNTAECDFNMGREKRNYWHRYSSYRTDAGDIDLFLIAGPSIREVIERYTEKGLYPYSKFYLRHIHDRLMKELDKNLALRVRKSEEDGKWIVSGRGVLHLSVLIETMRREGYELQVGQPQVIFKEIDGVKCEPIEELTINVPEEYASKMIDMVTRRKGEMVKMESAGERVNLEFDMPSRGIIGLRTNVLTASAGEAIMAHRFKEYQPYKGEIERRTNGSMIAMESGTAFAYAIDKLQDRGKFFIFPQEEVYAGQVVGEHSHDNDLVINVTKSKKLTNMRASGSDDKARLIPPVQFSLEEALEYIKEDEYVEVTPKSMRMRKVILDELERKRANKN